MQTYVLARTQIIERSLNATFAFFGDAYNLEKITPEFLRFRILTPRPIVMKAGTLIDYSLSLFGFPFQWQTRIEKWEPGVSFVDRQVTGPYALWVHTHIFKTLEANRTLMQDRVEYQLPLGLLGDVAHALFVEATLKKIFDHRAEVTAQLLAPLLPSYFLSDVKQPKSGFVTEAGD